MGNGGSGLSNFRKQKLVHEYYTFYDMNKDGVLGWEDFDLARQQLMKVRGFSGSDAQGLKELFITLWDDLIAGGDANNDGKITESEWVRMWEKFDKLGAEVAKENDMSRIDVLPPWLEGYMWLKFSTFDRAGAGEITTEDFEFILGEFGVPTEDAIAAFQMISVNGEMKVDFEYFQKLCHEYYNSDDPKALGNLINGKLDFESVLLISK